MRLGSLIAFVQCNSDVGEVCLCCWCVLRVWMGDLLFMWVV